ncbi:MAG: NAD-dependent deacylase [Chloroflexota bacterium]
MENQEIATRVDRLVNLIIDARKMVVFTGAGVSTESGIPDFRSPGGIWERFDPDDFTLQKFMTSKESRKKQWRLMREGHITEARPNPAHQAIAELDKLGRLDCVITQNIDCLHQKAGVPDRKVFELHGSNKWIRCLGCGQRYPYQEVKARLLAGEEIPDCKSCGGILKPEVVFFGESLPEDALEQAAAHARSADLFIVIGSSLVVYPAACMPVYAVDSGALLAIINLSPTPMDHQAAVLINGKAGEVMARVIAQLKARLAG